MEKNKVKRPPDNPLLRHEELNVDREVGSESNALAEARLAALAYTQTMPSSNGEEGVQPMPGRSNWVQLGPTVIPKGQTYSPPTRVLVTGRITSIVIDPTDANTIYVGAAQGGVWKTTDRGKNWYPKSDHEVSLAIGALAIDPSHPQTLYAGTGEGNFSLDSYYGVGVLKTTNGGNSWIQIGPQAFKGARFCRIVINPVTPATLFVATTAGVFRSQDAALNWTKLTNGLPALPATDVAIDPVTPTTVYAAFWGGGVYRATNANAANPTWTQLASGLPTTGFSRIALGLAPSSPQTLYALVSADATLDYLINQFYRSTDGGNTWTPIPLPKDPGGQRHIDGQGFYNLNVAVDPTTPDIVYLSAISLWKAAHNPLTDTWTFTDIGKPIHPDNHALAFDPTDQLVIYAGNDGGVYRSSDGGMSWDDTLNRDLCITQCEFMEQHPTSDAVFFIGTQDNGTEQYRNSPVFYHADDGDGGFVAIDPVTPKNVLSTYYGLSPKRSVTGGAFGSWTIVNGGLFGDALFYPPLTLDQSNANNIAIGSDRVFLDQAQGTGGWQLAVTLPGLAVRESVSALNYVNSNLIYAATEFGKVYRLTRSGGTWTATAIHAAPLPGRFIWDVVPRPNTPNTVIVVMSGFGAAHVWRGVIPASGAATWTDISGVGVGRLPDIPVNALAIEPSAPDTMYIATDIAVFRTTDGGTTWTLFSEGLPNCAVFDMRLHDPTRLLRVATHGRGVWERQLDAVPAQDVDLYVRDHLMHTGRRSSSQPASMAFDDPLQHAALGDPAWWWQCADIKIDALEGAIPAYQFHVSEVDYATFEWKLEHRNPQRGRVNRVYVQVHNRGIQPTADVMVKILYANASAGLPDLPADFWTAFPNDSVDVSRWKPIGAAQMAPLLSPDEPTVLEWEWNTPTTAADHSCMLVVMDSPSDPLPPANKVFNVAALIAGEKRVGLKNLHVVTAPPGTIYWTPFQFFGDHRLRHLIHITRATSRGWRLGMMFARGTQRELRLDGITRSKPTAEELGALEQKMGAAIEGYDLRTLYRVDNLRKGAGLAGLRMPEEGLQAMLLLVPATRNGSGTFSMIQEAGEVVVGGSTFVLRQGARRG